MGLPFNESESASLEACSNDALITVQSSLSEWLLAWGNWIDLWQQDNLHTPDQAAMTRLLEWRRTLPEQSFQELHALLDQLLMEETSQTEKLAVLQILKSWQRSMLRLNNRAYAARV